MMLMGLRMVQKKPTKQDSHHSKAHPVDRSSYWETMYFWWGNGDRLRIVHPFDHEDLDQTHMMFCGTFDLGIGLCRNSSAELSKHNWLLKGISSLMGNCSQNEQVNKKCCPQFGGLDFHAWCLDGDGSTHIIPYLGGPSPKPPFLQVV